jgi:acetyltransferase-like isoleucine patch superfamily enzyme
MGAIVVEKKTVGRQSVVAAGALVARDVPDRVQVMGSPAEIIQKEIDGL